MIEVSAALAIAAQQGRLAFLDAGVSSATVLLYDGARPAAGAAPTGTLLSSIPLPKPSGAVNGQGVLVLAAPASGMNLASGTPTWARVMNGEGNFAFDCDVGDTGEIVLQEGPVLYAGGTTTILSGALG